MIYYLKFDSRGDHSLTSSGTTRRCNLGVSPDGKRFTMTMGFVRSLHSVEAADEAAAVIALGLVPISAPALSPQQALAEAEKNGIDVPLGTTTFRLKCMESDRNAFGQRATLFLTAQGFMTEAQKSEHRSSNTVIVDAAGQAHTITVGEYQQLIVSYGAAYDALWTAAEG
jgi:hypothetical protein